MGSAPADPGYLFFLFNKIQDWTLIVVNVVISCHIT